MAADDLFPPEAGDAAASPAAEPEPRSRAWPRLPLAALIIAGVEAALLCTRQLPLGLPGVWVWPWRSHPVTPGLVAFAGAAFFLLAALAFGDGIRKRQEPARAKAALLVILLTLAQLVLTFCIAADEPLWPARVAGSTISDAAVGYYSIATRTDGPARFLADYHAHLAGPEAYPQRVATHPPGPTLFCYFVRQACLAHPALMDRLERMVYDLTSFDATLTLAAGGSVTSAKLTQADGVIALIVPGLLALLSAACVPLMYALARQLLAGETPALRGRRVGIIAAFLAAGLPALCLFVPSIDGVAAAFGLATLALFVAALQGGKWGAFVLAGIVWGLGLLWTYGLLSLVIVMALLLVAQPRWRNRAQAAALVGVGALLPFVLLALTCGYHPLAALRGSLDVQKAIMAQFGRTYSAWVPMNLWDVVLFLGGLAILCRGGTQRALRKGSAPLARLAAFGVVLQMLFLLVSGETRGEVGRIWLPQIALFLPFAAAAFEPITEGRMLATAGIVAIGQVGFMLAMYGMVRVVGF